MIKFTKRGLAKLRKSNKSVRQFILNREAIISRQGGTLGCALGFRQHLKLADVQTSQALYWGELATLRRAIIHNGFHPSYR